jgi:hypothetical protein
MLRSDAKRHGCVAAYVRRGCPSLEQGVTITHPSCAAGLRMQKGIIPGEMASGFAESWGGVVLQSNQGI